MTHKKNAKQITSWAQAIAVAILFGALFFPHASLAFGKQEPTAIIVDNETGQPIEGAAAVAQWIGHSWIRRAWWEGGTDYLIKAKESFSDKTGRVSIDGFWGTYVLSRKPRLTVYKPGYAVWDSEAVFGAVRNPAEFNETQRTIRLNKFEKDAAIFLKRYPTLKYLHIQHQFFLESCLNRKIRDKYEPGTIKIEDIFYKHEEPFLEKESVELSNERKHERK